MTQNRRGIVLKSIHVEVSKEVLPLKQELVKNNLHRALYHSLVTIKETKSFTDLASENFSHIKSINTQLRNILV